MTEKAKSKSILACIDGSNVTKSVCDYATWYAGQLKLDVQLLHVIDVPKSTRHDLSGAIGMDSRSHLLHELALIDEKTAHISNQHGHALLTDAKSHIIENHPHFKNEVRIRLRRSKLLPAIEYVLENTHAVILGRRGQDHQNDWVNIGSQIENVVRTVHRPIMVCSDDYIKPKSYMLAFDNSPTAQKAVQLLCKSPIAKTLYGHVVMVGEDNHTNLQALEDAQNKMIEAGLNVTAHLIPHIKTESEDVVAKLTDYRISNNISMFIIGAYGKPKWRQFFVGSTTTKLLTKTKAPVILLR